MNPATRSSLARGRRFGAPAILAALALLAYVVPGAGRALEYDRAAIASGQLWRLITGHWTHASLEHLLWDVLVFALLAAVLAARSPSLFRRTVLVAPLLISGALLLIGTEWQRYRGLSGIDSALFVALCTLLWKERAGNYRWLAATALLLFSAKIAFETATGGTLFLSDQAEQVVPLAHLAGAAAGLLCALLPSAADPASPSKPAINDCLPVVS